MTDIKKVARDAAEQAWPGAAVPGSLRQVADAVAVAMLREVYASTRQRGRAPDQFEPAMITRAEIADMLAAFTPAEPPQPGMTVEQAAAFGDFALGILPPAEPSVLGTNTKEHRMDKAPLRSVAERIIENLEQMDLPKVAHGARESMISEVEGTLRGMLTEHGFVRLEKPEPQTGHCEGIRGVMSEQATCRGASEQMHSVPAEPQTPEPETRHGRSKSMDKRLNIMRGLPMDTPQPAAPVSSSARPARALKDYRPQHDEDCDSRRKFRLMYSDPLTERSGPCTCGLDALLAPVVPAPKLYSACRICGRGPQTMTQHAAIMAYGVHTDANGKPNQPNNGTAYCDRCKDETLVIQPVVPAGETCPQCATTEAEAFKAGLETERVYGGEGGWEWFHHPTGRISKTPADALAAYRQSKKGSVKP